MFIWQLCELKDIILNSRFGLILSTGLYPWAYLHHWKGEILGASKSNWGKSHPWLSRWDQFWNLSCKGIWLKHFDCCFLIYHLSHGQHATVHSGCCMNIYDAVSHWIMKSTSCLDGWLLLENSKLKYNNFSDMFIITKFVNTNVCCIGDTLILIIKKVCKNI